jgi:hypothetical protein
MADIRFKLWQRKGAYYYAYIYIANRHAQGTITKRLSFLRYHTIRLIHGEDRLKDMIMDSVPTGDR